ncbi:single-stranded DNA-binding protein [Sphaerisporangium melleum]|uniref:Single-stranded DNA-binding protein n=1 Tax=Sphaerisporangium melleum TaxID=321316 RepID=A0A917VII0_9ACTN|nr:single-stranded DNA-binding protein [Sphaerisporangium melleum]GGK81819.1 single-stranded DNA-binding protein [Sphaerisporangium melleum]GII73800.1 single-stranded DNA-binding protein [Sphaerisporangium melleum]
MSNDTVITVVGNLVADPDLRFVPSGRAVATVRLASTPRFLDRSSGEWKDADTLFITCNVWGQQGENVAESLQRGHKVIVRGRLKQRSYETPEGERRTVVELDAEDIGPSLATATARMTRTQRATTMALAADLPQPSPSSWNGAPADPWASAPVPAGVGHDGSPSF